MEYQQNRLENVFHKWCKMQHIKKLKYKINNQLNKNSITHKKKIWYNLIMMNGNKWQFILKHLGEYKF